MMQALYSGTLVSGLGVLVEEFWKMTMLLTRPLVVGVVGLFCAGR